MPRLTLSDLDRITSKAGYTVAGGLGSALRADPVIQERQADQGKAPDRRQKSRKAKSVPHARYRVRATFMVSDRRVRDGDNMLSTVFDSLVDAVGRLSKLDSRSLVQHPDGTEGS